MADQAVAQGRSVRGRSGSVDAASFAVSTNACPFDYEVISHTLPSWLRVFGDRLTQLHVVVDEEPASGRIAVNRGRAEWRPDMLWKVLMGLASADHRVKVVTLREEPLQQYVRAWFSHGTPDRCQAGTPILAFVAAFETPDAEFVLRADCDMLFCEKGWLALAMDLLACDQTDIVEPPRLGFVTGGPGVEVSTRALMVRAAAFRRRCLPISPYRLDVFRRLHRVLHGRPTWLALEQMLDVQRRRGRVRHAVLDSALGFSVHVDQRSFSSPETFVSVVKRIEAGEAPLGQCKAGWNLWADAWLAGCEFG